MRDPTLIDLVEQAYDLDSNDEGWLAAVNRSAAAVFDASRGAFTYSFHVSHDNALSLGQRVESTDFDAGPMLNTMIDTATLEVIHHFYRGIRIGPTAVRVDGVF